MATKKKTARWSGAKQASDAAAGRSKAESDRKLQRQAESRRKGKSTSSKEGAVQAGARRYPETPLPKQRLQKPGLESDLEPRPMYRAPRVRLPGAPYCSSYISGEILPVLGGQSG